MEKQSLLQRIIKKRIIIMILLLVMMLLVFAILSTPNKSFLEIFKGSSLILKPKNLANIINSMPLSVFLTTGITLLMISGKLDLSTGANGTLCAMLIAYLLRSGMPLVPAVLVTLGVGLFMGFINGTLVNGLNVAPFIATLATSTVATGLVYFIADKKTIDITNPFLKWYGSHMLFGYIPVSAVVAFGFMIIAGIVLHRTSFGRKIYLVGGNPQAAMLSGINPKKMSYLLFMICGLASALAGISFAARQQSANMQGITQARFQGITAAVLGGIAFGGGSGGMAGAFVGLLVLSTFSNGLTVIGLNPYLQNVATGLLLIFALILDFIQKQQSLKTLV